MLTIVSACLWIWAVHVVVDVVATVTTGVGAAVLGVEIMAVLLMWPQQDCWTGAIITQTPSYPVTSSQKIRPSRRVSLGLCFLATKSDYRKINSLLHIILHPAQQNIWSVGNQELRKYAIIEFKFDLAHMIAQSATTNAKETSLLRYGVPYSSHEHCDWRSLWHSHLAHWLECVWASTCQVP
jgi:hypothetical protein